MRLCRPNRGASPANARAGPRGATAACQGRPGSPWEAPSPRVRRWTLATGASPWAQAGGPGGPRAVGQLAVAGVGPYRGVEWPARINVGECDALQHAVECEEEPAMNRRDVVGVECWCGCGVLVWVWCVGVGVGCWCGCGASVASGGVGVGVGVASVGAAGMGVWARVGGVDAP
eukprot:3483869-Prymnesium_polylepis.2